MAKFVPQPRSAISFAALDERLADFLGKNAVLAATRSAIFVGMVIKAATADLQSRANLVHQKSLPGIGAKAFNQTMTLGDSCPKMAKAFFKMSRCLVMV
jgi:hypothetical protein